MRNKIFCVYREFYDFAGSGVVHLAGGTCALVGAIMLGPRIGRFGPGGENLPMPGHSVPFISLGAFILIFGFFAFNGGSQAQITGAKDGEVVARAVVNTLLGCIGGGLAVLITTKIFRGGKWSLVQLINGCLAGKDESLRLQSSSSLGMVSVCAGCDAFMPWAGTVVGTIAGVLYIFFSKLMTMLRIDDPLDAVAVHMGSGLWGLVAAPLFLPDGDCQHCHGEFDRQFQELSTRPPPPPS